MLDDAPTNPTDLADLEKRQATRLDLGSATWVLMAAVAAFVVALFLPFAGDVAGWQMLTFTEPSGAAVMVAERVFTVLGTLALVVLTTLTLTLKRTSLALFAWMAACVALVMALFGYWLRQTGNSGVGTGPGMYLAVLAVAAAVPVLTSAWLRRDPEQRRVEELRRGNTEFNPVAEVQTSAAHQAIQRTDGSTGIVDDRRARAAERHRDL